MKELLFKYWNNIAVYFVTYRNDLLVLSWVVLRRLQTPLLLVIWNIKIHSFPP